MNANNHKGTVFSYIVQRQLSRKNENVATEALAYILGYSKKVRNGMMKLLRGVVPELPDLRFQTQPSEGKNRPDMCGYAKADPHVFVENKFWAALTENQPVSYIEQLAKYTQPTILLVVVPEAREQMFWRVLNRRLKKAGISAKGRNATAGIVCSVSTDEGPILALTSWTRLISALELEAADDQRARSDLLQLQALCQAADTDVPISAEEVSDQRTPALILQLSSIVESAVGKAVSEGVLNLKGSGPGKSTERIGRYASFGATRHAGMWLGIHFELWKSCGETPLWAVFNQFDPKHDRDVRELLERWAAQNGVFATSHEDGTFVVAIDIVFGEEKDQVVGAIVSRLREFELVLSKLKSKWART